MDIYEGILEAVEKELEEVSKSRQFKSTEEVRCVYELVGIARRIHAIWAYEEPQAEMGSLFSRSYEGRGGSYDDGYSNRRGSSYRRMSRDSGTFRNSRHDEKSFVEKMQRMRDEAPDEQTKMEIDRLLSQMG